MKALIEKLSKVKNEIGKISKDLENPFYKSKYFDINKLLEHVEPLLEKYGLLLIQPIKNNQVYTIIYNIEDSSQFVESGITLPDLIDPQKLGSAITYYRRYTLQSLLGLQAEDDDGNSASKAVNEQKGIMQKKWFNPGEKPWTTALEKEIPLDEVKKHYNISRANAEKYLQELTKDY